MQQLMHSVQTKIKIQRKKKKNHLFSNYRTHFGTVWLDLVVETHNQIHLNLYNYFHFIYYDAYCAPL